MNVHVRVNVNDDAIHVSIESASFMIVELDLGWQLFCFPSCTGTFTCTPTMVYGKIRVAKH
jgi:hypothetical protein